jgi:TPR repeat protein
VPLVLVLCCAARLLLFPHAALLQADRVQGGERAPRASHANGAGYGAPASERVGESEGQRPSDDDDVVRALTAVRERAAAGDPLAQFSLGAFLYFGSPQTAEGNDWIRKAALQRFAPAEYHLGQVYEFGFGVQQDDRLALEWYRKAAGDGSVPAHRAIGEFYLKGRAVRADAAEAARWFRRGADGDDLRAQYQLGQLHFDGTGVPRDYESAYVWFTVAAGQTPLEDNRKGLLELRNIAAARMTPAAIAAATRRVAAWKPVVRSQ